MKHENVPRNYKTSFETGAKKIALADSPEFDTDSNPEMAFEVWLANVERLELRGDYAEAVKILDSRWKFLSSEVDLENLSKKDSAQLLLRIGSLLSVFGTTDQIKDAQDKARDFLWKAERFFDELEDSEGKAICLNKIGISYWRNGDMSAARGFFDDAMGFARTDESKATVFLYTSMTEQRLKNHFSALKFAEKAYLLIDKVSTLLAGNIRNSIGIVYEICSNDLDELTKSEYIDRALIEYEGAILCYEEAGQQRFEIGTRNNIAFLYYTIGQYQNAVTVLQTAKTRAYQLKDKIQISTVCDTLARAYIALKDYEAALSNSTIAIKYLEKNESSNRLSNFLCTHAIALARCNRTAEARENFQKAENVAEYIGDRTLIAQVRLLKLRELFSEFSEIERVSIFEDVQPKIINSKDKDTVEAIKEVTSKITTGTVKPNTNESQSPSDFISQYSEKLEAKLDDLDKAESVLVEKQKELFANALRQTNGNKMRAAKLLGMKRQTMISRIRRMCPEILDKYEQVQPAKETTVKVFPSYLIANVSQPSATIGLLRLNEKYYSVAAGDILLVEIGTWYFNHTVALRNFYSPNGPALIGVIRDEKFSFALEQPDGRRFDFHNEQLIIGNVIGYCRNEDFEEFLEKQKNGGSIEMPINEIKF